MLWLVFVYDIVMILWMSEDKWNACAVACENYNMMQDDLQNISEWVFSLLLSVKKKFSFYDGCLIVLLGWSQ